MNRLSIPRSGAFVLVVASLGVLQSPDDDGVEPVPSIALTLDPTSGTPQQGTLARFDVTVSGTNGFSGTPTITVTNLPAGVTSTVLNLQTTGSTTTATVELAIGAATPPGTYNVTVTGAATGVSSVTAIYALMVAPSAGPEDYSLSAAPATLTLTQGGGVLASTISINRTGGFAGSVALRVEGAPAGMTATLDPASSFGTTQDLRVNALGGSRSHRVRRCSRVASSLLIECPLVELQPGHVIGVGPDDVHTRPRQVDDPAAAGQFDVAHVHPSPVEYRPASHVAVLAHGTPNPYASEGIDERGSRHERRLGGGKRETRILGALAVGNGDGIE
jgi:hypothetical protein